VYINDAQQVLDSYDKPIGAPAAKKPENTVPVAPKKIGNFIVYQGGQNDDGTTH
jgi:hypothetical protein